jgi:hypothetical protein
MIGYRYFKIKRGWNIEIPTSLYFQAGANVFANSCRYKSQHPSMASNAVDDLMLKLKFPLPHKCSLKGFMVSMEFLFLLF